MSKILLEYTHVSDYSNYFQKVPDRFEQWILDICKSFRKCIKRGLNLLSCKLYFGLILTQKMEIGSGL